LAAAGLAGAFAAAGLAAAFFAGAAAGLAARRDNALPTASCTRPMPWASFRLS
jgi:hypothetical protein